MVDIIEHIDDTIIACIGRGKTYGLCRLLLDDKGVPYPATVENTKKVTPEDRWELIWYHRLMDGSADESELFSFGRSMSALSAQRIRTVVVAAFSEGEDTINEIIASLPENIVNVDYKYLNLGREITLIRDRTSIWETEWGDAYKDKYQMRYNIYALEYSVSYIKCAVCVD